MYSPPPPGTPDEEVQDDPYVTPMPRAYPKSSDQWYTKGLETVGETPKITGGLMRRRYSPTDIGKIMGEDWLRGYEQVWGGQQTASA